MPNIGLYIGEKTDPTPQDYKRPLKILAGQCGVTESQLVRALFDCVLDLESPELVKEAREMWERKINAPCDKQ